MGYPTVAVDFDGTIHPYTGGWQGSVPLDEPPLPGAEEFLHWLWAEDYEIVIFSTRAREIEGLEGIKAWLVKYDLDHYVSDISFTKPKAIAYVDDRAVAYLGDWEDVKLGVRQLHGASRKE
jgi:hypothetical protein